MRALLFVYIALVGAIIGPVSSAYPSQRYPAQVSFQVRNDDGAVVPNVDITVRNFLRWEPGEGFGRDVYEDIKVRTDSAGLAVLSVEGERGWIDYGIYNVKEHYATSSLRYSFKEVIGGRWEPWNPLIEIVLKPVLNPVPLYARRVGARGALLELPVVGEAVGFDLMAGDWVAPYGKGNEADLVFTLHEIVSRTSIEKAFMYRLEIGFSNPGDGIQSIAVPALPHEGSELRLPRFAPEVGYERGVVKVIGRPSEGQPMHVSARDDLNYFIRIRTQIDANGRITSALYAKIVSDFVCDIINSKNGYIQFAYCLNPTPMDRNLEFDPRRNLFGELPRNQRVMNP